MRRYPSVEILVNSLGSYEPKPFKEITDEEWLRMFEVNVLSAVRAPASDGSGRSGAERGEAATRPLLRLAEGAGS